MPKRERQPNIRLWLNHTGSQTKSTSQMKKIKDIFRNSFTLGTYTKGILPYDRSGLIHHYKVKFVDDHEVQFSILTYLSLFTQ